MDDQSRERVSNETKQAERREAHVEGQPDRPPTEDEERRAEELELDPEVAEAYEEAAERGANQEGEGRVEL